MRKRFIIPAVLAMGVLFIRADCDLVSFDAQPLIVTATWQKIYDIDSNNTSYSKVETINVAQLYADAGINSNNIQETSLQIVEVVITENNTGDSTTATGFLQFRNAASSGAWTQLASFSNVNLNSILNQPINPFTAVRLGVDGAAATAFSNLFAQSPPPMISADFAGSVNTPPVDFKARVVIKIQVKFTN